MGLDHIRRAILDAANAESRRILEAAKKTARGSAESEKRVIAQEIDRTCRGKMQAIEEEYNRKIIQSKGVAGKKVLNRRNTVLRSLFEKAREEILTRPSERYERVMKEMVDKAAAGHEGRLRVHPEEEHIFRKLLSELNQTRGHGPIILDSGSPLPRRGGFIFESSRFEIDRTLDTILLEVEHDLLPSVAAELFPEKRA
jgi:vacuolar-type H+-ATPase subunit E/Vma4